MESDGYSLDDKRTKQEGYGDLQEIVMRYHERHQRNEIDRTKKCFVVPKAEIVSADYDLSISKYKEDVFEEIVYENPAVILGQLKMLEQEINQELAELEGMLG